MDRQYIPYGPHVWIKVLPVEQATLTMTGDDRDKPVRGEVLAIGEGVEGIRVGQVIIYDYYSAVEPQRAEDETLLIHKDDILAIEKEDANGN